MIKIYLYRNMIIKQNESNGLHALLLDTQFKHEIL